MRVKPVYLILCVLGTILPLRHLVLFFYEHGIDMTEFIHQIYATRIGAFFTADVVVSATVLVVFVVVEGRRIKMPRYLLPLLGLAVGVSLAFPWFLFLRHRHLTARLED